MARAKATPPVETVEPTVEPVAEAVEPVAETPEPVEEVAPEPVAPPVDPAAFSKAALELSAAPIDEWAKAYAKIGLIGLRYDNGVQWSTIGAIDPANPDTATIQRALYGNYHTLLYVSDAFEVLFSTSRVDAKPFTVI